jgi:hypothetical protein
MSKTHIIGIAFAAVFAFSMASVSGASAVSLWDQCTKTAAVLEFTESNCQTTGSSPTWGWEEITSLLTVESLPTSMFLISGPITLKCKSSSDGSVGPGIEGEVTKFLKGNGENVTEAAPGECEVTAGASICTAPATTSPVNLPWLTLLQAAGGDLVEGSGAGAPGWMILCANGLHDLCTKEDILLSVENLLAELEVDLTANSAETAECTNALAKEGKFEGTASIFLYNLNGLRTM